MTIAEKIAMLSASRNHLWSMLEDLSLLQRAEIEKAAMSVSLVINELEEAK